jgi:alkanesulfonate monooxygenase SsuD/methylene tetrahydromethanopterin reductase-like flavin-dependent oxidoreductase (luciferase family)
MAVQIGIGLFTAQVPPDSDRTFTQEYREILDMVRLAETLGFDSAWVSEHHGSGDGYMPSLLPTLAAFAAATDRIKLGTGIMLTPFHHPLRLAEDAATVDLISGGRLILGLGLAWRQEEFRVFEVPLKERVRRTVETIDVLRLAWTGDRFSYQGKVFSYDRVRVPIWLGGSVEAAMRRAGRVADGYIRTRGGGLDKMKEAFQTVEAGAREAGKDASSMPMAQLQNTFVWEGDAWEIAGRYVPNQLGIYAGWDAGGDTPEKGFVLAPPDEETMRRVTPTGNAHEVIRALRPMIEAFAGRKEFHLIVRLHYPGMDFDTASRAIELFGERVLPALKGA